MPTTAPTWAFAQQNWASYIMSGLAQPGFWSRAGDGFQRAVLLKKQCLCFGRRAKCCLFPDAFLELGQGTQLRVIHAVTETGWGRVIHAVTETGWGQRSEEVTRLIQAWGHDAVFCPWLKGTQFPSLDGTCSKRQHSSLCRRQHQLLLHLIV